jgi:type I restriction-modification system DNA methylase subunit
MWAAADKLRGHMDASEYKHVVLGLIFLKYISDAFQAKYKELEATKDTEYTDPEDRDEYSAANIFWVPKEARWAKLQSSAKQQTIGKIVDDAMVAIEKENPTLKGVLPKDDSRPSLDKYRNDLYKDLRADFILANPPFNMSDWGGERLREDARWKYGIPPVNNANYAWIQHFIHHLSPTGVAGFVMANGSMSTNTTSEGEIRRNIIEEVLGYGK